MPLSTLTQMALRVAFCQLGVTPTSTASVLLPLPTLFRFIFNLLHPISLYLSPTFMLLLLLNIGLPSLTKSSQSPPPSQHPWMLCGDFNMIRYAHEKNKHNFRLSEAEAFNDCIDAMCLIELPLLDRSFTWSNKRTHPTLERLDRVFINLDWDEKLPGTILSSLTRSTSDHVLLKIDIVTSIPKSKLFRFENHWIRSARFREEVHTAWTYCRVGNSDPSAVMAAKLKATRASLRAWVRARPNLWQQETDCRIVINILDCVEENRTLSPIEQNLRTLIVSILSRTTHAKFLLWKQRSKVRAALEGDENTRYFHACANQRHRRNKIQVIEHDGCELHNHEQKAAVLHSFYVSLLGEARQTYWSFEVEEIYRSDRLDLDHLAAPFNQKEIQTAIQHMHGDASPGPDGFGSRFYKATWSTISPEFLALFEAFYTLSTDLERLNRSYLVLLPKKDHARKPQDLQTLLSKLSLKS